MSGRSLTAKIYIDGEGDFPVQLVEGDDSGRPAPDWIHVGDVAADEPMNPIEFCHWFADDCPDSAFPSPLTDGEIEEIRQKTRDGHWYGKETAGQ